MGFGTISVRNVACTSTLLSDTVVLWRAGHFCACRFALFSAFRAGAGVAIVWSFKGAARFTGIITLAKRRRHTLSIVVARFGFFSFYAIACVGRAVGAGIAAVLVRARLIGWTRHTFTNGVDL